MSRNGTRENCKYLVRLRETESDVLSERTYEFEDAWLAIQHKRTIEKAGFWGKVYRVLDREDLKVKVGAS